MALLAVCLCGEQWHCWLYTPVVSSGSECCFALWWAVALLAVSLCGEQCIYMLYTSVVSCDIDCCIPLLWAVSLYAYVYGQQYYCNLNACGEQWHCMWYTSGEQWACMLYTSVVSSDTSSCVHVWWAAILHAVYSYLCTFVVVNDMFCMHCRNCEGLCLGNKASNIVNTPVWLSPV